MWLLGFVIGIEAKLWLKDCCQKTEVLLPNTQILVSEQMTLISASFCNEQQELINITAELVCLLPA